MIVVIVVILGLMVLTSVLGAWFGLGLILIDLWGNNRRLCVTILAGLGISAVAVVGIATDTAALCPTAGLLAAAGCLALVLTRGGAATRGES